MSEISSMTLEQWRREWRNRIQTLSETVWEGRARKQALADWLEGFSGQSCSADAEQTYALFLLQQFIYFGQAEIEALLYALFRDHVLYPKIQGLLDVDPRMNENVLREELQRQVYKLRIVPVGGVSESATMLTYRLAKVAKLPPKLIQSMADVAGKVRARKSTVEHVIMIDDFVGTGRQVSKKHGKDVALLRRRGVRVDYVTLVAMEEGMESLEKLDIFDRIAAGVLLDRSYNIQEAGSHFLEQLQHHKPHSSAECLKCVQHYGALLDTEHPLGFNDSGAMVGFSHNTPNNTLPIFWKRMSRGALKWRPLFERSAKQLVFKA